MKRLWVILMACVAVFLFVVPWIELEAMVVYAQGVRNDVLEGQYPFSGPGQMAFSRNKTKLYVLNTDAMSVSIVDAALDVVMGVIPVGDNPMGIADNPIKDEIYVANTFSNTVSVIDTNRDEVINTIKVESFPIDLAVSEDGNTLYVSHSGARTSGISVIDLKTLMGGGTTDGTGIRFISDPSIVYPMGLAEVGGKLYVAVNGKNTVAVFSTASLSLIKTIAAGSRPDQIAISADKKYLYVTNNNEGSVSVIEVGLDTKIKDLPAGRGPKGMAILGDILYVVNNLDDTISIINTSENVVMAGNLRTGALPVDVAARLNEAGIPKVYVSNSGSDNSVSYIYGSQLKLEPRGEVTLKPGETQSFTVSGGSGQYRWVVTGGKVEPERGPKVVYTAPGLEGIYSITASDDTGARATGIIRVVNLVISPSEVNTTRREPITFTASGGSPPYKFTAEMGEIKMVDDHTITYLPPQESGIFTITLTDSQGNTAKAEVKISQPLSISPFSPVINPGESIEFTINGGIGDYTFQVQAGKIQIRDKSTIRYTAPATDGVFTLTVIDAAGDISSAVISVISPGGIAVTPGMVNLDLNQEQVFTIVGGTPPYSFSATRGDVKKGQRANEIIYTAPGVTGPANLVITDSSGKQAVAHINVTGRLSITPETADMDAGATAQFTAFGGTNIYNFMAEAGDMERISRTEILYTAPRVEGEYRITVFDTAGKSAVAVVSVVARVLVISPSQRVMYPKETGFFTAVGGVSPYTFVAESGQLDTSRGEKVSYTAPHVTGEYTITVSDARGSKSTGKIVVARSLHITPSTANLNVGETYKFTIIGGAGDYTVVATAGQLDSSSGPQVNYTAPKTLGQYKITAIDALGATAVAQITVGNAPRVTPRFATLRPGETQVFVPVGGTPPYTFTVDRGELKETTGMKTTFIAPDFKGKVTLTIMDNKNQETRAEIFISSGDSMRITPTTASIGPRGTRRFTVEGSLEKVTFESTAGSLPDPKGHEVVFTAPEEPGDYYIVAEGPKGEMASAWITITKEPQPQLISNLTRFTLGDELRIDLLTEGAGEVDMYLAVVLPDGTFFTLGEGGKVSKPNEIIPYSLGKYVSNGLMERLFTLKIPNPLPQGSYRWIVVYTPAGGNLSDIGNWKGMDELVISYE